MAFEASWFLVVGYWYLVNGKKPRTKNQLPICRHQLLGPQRCLNDCFDQRHPQTAFFQFDEAFNRASRRRGDGVFQQRRMMTRFKGKLGSAKHSLGGESGGKVAW